MESFEAQLKEILVTRYAEERLDLAITEILACHNADKQAYALGVLTDLRTKAVSIMAGEESWFEGEAVDVDDIDQAIAKVNQDLGREV